MKSFQILLLRLLKPFFSINYEVTNFIDYSICMSLPENTSFFNVFVSIEKNYLLSILSNYRYFTIFLGIFIINFFLSFYIFTLLSEVFRKFFIMLDKNCKKYFNSKNLLYLRKKFTKLYNCLGFNKKKSVKVVSTIIYYLFLLVISVLFSVFFTYIIFRYCIVIPTEEQLILRDLITNLVKMGKIKSSTELKAFLLKYAQTNPVYFRVVEQFNIDLCFIEIALDFNYPLNWLPPAYYYLILDVEFLDILKFFIG